MNDRTKNILIGLFVTGALATMVAFVLFLKPTVGDGKKTLLVRFCNIAGISVGTRVTWAGKPIGEVTHIQELPNARTEADESGRIYLYQLTLKIDSSTDVYSSDEIAIKTTGLMGEKSIAILPKLPQKNKTATLITNQIAYANSTDPLENTFNQVAKVANRLEASANNLDLWFKENQYNIAKAIRSFEGAMGQVDTLLATVDAEKLVPSLKESSQLLNNNLQNIQSCLEEDQLLQKIAALVVNFDDAVNQFNTYGAQTLNNLNQISKEIATGSGTIGRLISGDDLYLRIASLMNKGETLMNDINHYGILFQYNKQWQKSRTKRANLLRSLDTPQEFKNYFEAEVDSMTTSLGRLSELMDRAAGNERSEIMQSEAFKRNFAALLRQVQGLSDSLKLYNEGMIAKSEEFTNDEL
jgi:phospholipid/cholesterol/gamma-HCH transport system substrate-binding protein